MEDWEKETCVNTGIEQEVQLTPNCKVKYLQIAWMEDNDLQKQARGDTTKYGLSVLKKGVISGPFPDKEAWIIKLKPDLVEIMVKLITGRDSDLEELKKNSKS